MEALQNTERSTRKVRETLVLAHLEVKPCAGNSRVILGVERDITCPYSTLIKWHVNALKILSCAVYIAPCWPDPQHSNQCGREDIRHTYYMSHGANSMKHTYTRLRTMPMSYR